MANKPIGSLPSAEAIQGSDYLAIEQSGVAKKAEGNLFRSFAVGAVSPLVTQAQEAATSAQTSAANAGRSAFNAGAYANSAQDSMNQASSYADSAVSAKNAAEAARDIAVSSKDEAVSSKVAAQTAATTAASAKDDAEAAADLAEEAWENIETKADINGSYDSLTSGYAKDILSTKGDSDDSAYLIRNSGGDVDIYETEVVKEIEGASISWNQLVTDEEKSGSDVVSASLANGKWVFSGSPTANTTLNFIQNLNIPSHKLLVLQPTGFTGVRWVVRDNTNAVNILFTASGSPIGSKIFDVPSTCVNLAIYPQILANTVLDGYSTLLQVIDLTLFNKTIADYVYSLETATAGTGIAWLNANFPGIFNSYHPYTVGEIVNVRSKGRKVTGINQWDEEWEVGGIDLNTGANNSQTNVTRAKNQYVCSPSATYYLGTNIATIFWYTDNGTFISYQYNNLTGNVATAPDNAGKFRFITKSSYGTTYHNDICINISDPSINGQYFPYEGVTYEHSDLPLRGLYKIEDGKLTTYGDIYKPSGKVRRRFGIIDLGTLTYLYSAGSSVFYSANVNSWMKLPANKATPANIISDRYDTVAYASSADKTVFTSWTTASNKWLYIRDSSYTDAATFKAAMSGHYLLYELASETEEETAPYQETQKIFAGGTERFIDERDIALPVGINSFFPIPTVSKLDALPFVTGEDGLYILEEEDKSLSLKSFDEAVELAIEKGIVARPIEEDISNTSIASFPDGAENVAVKELTVDIPVQQDLHGYDAPWPGGGRKNLCKVTGFWTTSYNLVNPLTVNGLTATVIDQMKVKINGTSTSNSPAIRTDKVTLSAGTYTASVTKSGDTSSITCYIHHGSTGESVSYTGQRSFTLTEDTDCYFEISYQTGATASNAIISFQIESGSTKTAWEPYENVCPILPVTEVEVTRVGKNIFDDSIYSAYKTADYTYSSTMNNLLGKVFRIPKSFIGKQLTFSANFTSVQSPLTYVCTAAYVNGVGTEGTHITSGSTGTSKITFTPQTTNDYVRITFGSGGSGIVIVKNFQLELGDTTTDFEPYTPQIEKVNIGINQWDEEWEVGTISTSTGENETATNRVRSKNYISVIPNGEYYCKKGESPTTVTVYWYDENKQFISSVNQSWSYGTKTIPANAHFMRFVYIGTTYANDISVNYPSRFTSYYQYTGNVVYGGELDVPAGVLTSIYKFKHLTGAETTSITGQVRTPYNGWAFSVTGYGIDCKAGAEAYSSINKPTFYSSAKVTGFCKALSVAPIFFLLDSDSGLDSTATLAQIRDAYIAYITETKPMIAYEITNPITIQLTPTEVKTFLKNNIIYSDSGDILKLTYRADIKAYIEKVIS